MSLDRQAVVCPSLGYRHVALNAEVARRDHPDRAKFLKPVVGKQARLSYETCDPQSRKEGSPNHTIPPGATSPVVTSRSPSLESSST
jgi:hypothetical protein